MIGTMTAGLESRPRRWLERVWGCPDVHTRQKWTALWPFVSQLSCGPLRVLDAGCGDGRWSLELAMRRPAWTIVGLDRSSESIRQAEASRARLDVHNVEFICADFLQYRPEDAFNAILSVASAHYLVETNHGETLFRAFVDWLAPQGALILFGPRCEREVPRIDLLPPPFKLRPVFSERQLRDLCAVAQLGRVNLYPVIGFSATVAKQINRAFSTSRVMASATYPIQIVLTTLDRLLHRAATRASSAWVLTAQVRGVEAVTLNVGDHAHATAAGLRGC